MRVTLSMPSPPAGPVPAMIILRTSRGCCCAITWAIMPPIENPNRSTRSRSRARMKVTASLAIPSMVLGVAPLEAPTPRLSKVMTRRLAAMPSTTRGSQLSRTAARWGRKTTGTPVLGRADGSRTPRRRRGWSASARAPSSWLTLLVCLVAALRGGELVGLADLLVEDPGGDEAAEHADAAGPRACGVPQLRSWVGCRRDDHLGDHGGVVPGLHPLGQDGFEGLPSPLVDREWVVTPHHARVEAGARVEGLDEQNPDTVLANLVIDGLGVALDRVLGRDIAGHEGLGANP